MTHRGVAALLLALGATVGTALDGLHTYSGATAYAAPLFLKSTWWVPPLFAGAGLAIGMGRLLGDRITGKTTRPPSSHAAVVAMLVFFAAYAASGFVDVDARQKAGLLAAAFVLLWAAIDRTLAGVLCAIGSGLGGLAVEATLVHFGAFRHRDANMLGVAFWIPPLYAIASVAVGGLTLRLLAPLPSPAFVSDRRDQIPRQPA